MEYDQKPRMCNACGYILKEGEKRCPKCFPANPSRNRGDSLKKLKTEPWYCADCKHKFPPEFQECPVCKKKTHEFCEDCGTLIEKGQPCPICSENEDWAPEALPPPKFKALLKPECDNCFEWQPTDGCLADYCIYDKPPEEIAREVTEEDVQKIEELVEQGRKIPLEEAIEEKGSWGRRGRPPGKRADARKKNAFPNKRKADGRKNNRPPKAREKQKQQLEEPEEPPEEEVKEEEQDIPEDVIEALKQKFREVAPEKPVQALLKLDLDGKNGLNNLCERIWIIKYLGLKVLAVEIYHTTNGFHAVLQCDNIFKSWEILLFQTWLGSDFRREMCNLLKIERGTENWNTLFREKWKCNVLGEEIRVSQESYDAELSEKVLRLIQLGE